MLLILRNATTDSPWPVSNNPDAKYNDRAWACRTSSLAAYNNWIPLTTFPSYRKWDAQSPNKSISLASQVSYNSTTDD